MYDSKSYIYMLYNFANNKIYVGHTVHPEIRKRDHINALRRGSHPNKEMQADFDKFGDVFFFTIIEEKCGFREKSNEYEWMRKLKTYDERYGYNTHDWATQGMRKSAGLSYLFPKSRKA